MFSLDDVFFHLCFWVLIPRGHLVGLKLLAESSVGWHIHDLDVMLSLADDDLLVLGAGHGAPRAGSPRVFAGRCKLGGKEVAVVPAAGISRPPL